MVGFKKAVQATGYVILGCLVIGNALVRTAYPSKSVSEKVEKPNIIGFFTDPPYVWAVLGYVITPNVLKGAMFLCLFGLQGCYC